MAAGAQRAVLDRHWPWLAALVAVLAVAFWPALGGEFVMWDDSRNFMMNQDFRGLGAPQLKWAWTTTLMGHYVPLSWMSLEVDYVLWGMDARGYHLTSLAIHIANAVLVYGIAIRLLPAHRNNSPRFIAAVASLLFAAHPLRVESVAWITERRDVLSLFFALLATLAYLRQASEARLGKWYVLTLLAFVAALLSKASVLTLPAVFLVLNWYPLDRLRCGFKRLALELAPLFLLSGVASVVSIIALEPGTQLAFTQKVAVSAYSLCFYVVKSVWPVGLAALYPMPLEVRPWSPVYLAAYAGVIVMIAVLVIAIRRAAALAATLLAFFILVSPFLGLVQNGQQLVADRYTYVAGIAFALLAAAGISRLHRSRSTALALTIVILLVFGTRRQTRTWTSSGALWTRVLEVDSTSFLAHNNLGTVMAEQGDRAGAISHYQRSIDLNPANADPYNNLGVELAELGRLDDAIVAYSQALRLRPELHGGEANLANAFAMKGDFAAAFLHYERAVALNPNLVGVRYNWALTLVNAGRLAEAKTLLEQVMALDPQMSEARSLYTEVLRAMTAKRSSDR